MESALVASELRAPLRRVMLLPVPTSHGWRLRVVRALLAVIPSGKLEGVTIETPRTTGATSASDGPHVRLYRPAVRRSPAALFWIHGGGLVIGGRSRTIASAR